MDLQVESSWFEDAVLGRTIIVLLLAAVALAVSAATARASITLGQLAPTTNTGFCNSNDDRVAPTVTSGNTYVLPGAGTLTSWSTNAGANTGQEMTMKVFRRVSEPDEYAIVAHDGPRDLIQNSLNSFTIGIAVKAGDVLGLNSPTTGTAATYCDFPVMGESYPFHSGDLADGQSASFTDTQLGERLNISAVFVPSNGFSIGAVQRNKKSGTATLTVSVPGPGELVTSGAGLTTAAPGAVPSTAVAGPGDVQILIRATGAKGKKLKKKGKVSVTPSVTYTPSGGDAATQATAVTLKLKHKKKHH